MTDALIIIEAIATRRHRLEGGVTKPLPISLGFERKGGKNHTRITPGRFKVLKFVGVSHITRNALERIQRERGANIIKNQPANG